MEPRHIKRKVLLLGDGAVGKTSLIRKYVLDKFDDKYITTIGTKVTKKVMELEQDGEPVELTLMIWDILGQKGYTSIQASSFKGAEGVMLVCDITRKETLPSLEDYWLAELAKVREDIPMVFVGNKVDLIDERQITEDDLVAMTDKFKTEFFMSSAKTGENVESMFKALGHLVISDVGAEADTGAREAKEVRSLIDVADMIITEFAESFGDRETAMAMVRQQFSRADVRIDNPTKESLLLAVEYLAEAEKGFADDFKVNSSLAKRKRLIEQYG